jgi:hypothetical protein
VEKVADAIVSAQRNNLEDVSVPRELYHINNLMRLLSNRVQRVWTEFADIRAVET